MSHAWKSFFLEKITNNSFVLSATVYMLKELTHLDPAFNFLT